jgi:tRNA pseudouridine38-40 synthase
MATYKLIVEYDGTRYSGWQVQKNTPRTVAGQIERAASEAYGDVDLGGAGRTDAGVHASGQVAHMRIRRRVRPLDVQYDLNDRLPHDIHIVSVDAAPDNFHARHDATTRVYLYQISTRRTAFGKPFVWWIKDQLDVAAMQYAVERIGGMHDFSAFTDRRIATESTKVLVEFAEIGVAGDLILLRLSASHFLWKMVRKLVAAFVEVGRGNLSVDEFDEILSSGATFQPTAPPSGLFLESILYQGEVFDRPLEPIVPVFRYAPAGEQRWQNTKKKSSR